MSRPSAPSARDTRQPPAGTTPSGAPRSAGWHREARWLVVAAAVVLALFTAGLVGRGTGAAPAPGDDSVAAGFARDMTDHHAQAVQMASIVHDRTHDADIRTLTTDIALTQTSQMGQMRGWLDTWHLRLGRTGQPMTWMTSDGDGMDMGHGGDGKSGAAGMDPSLMRLRPDGLMPGMATAAQINQLRTLPPDRADIVFLQLMIRHHTAGVAMARMALDLTDNAQVKALARSVVASQEAEITQMTQMLRRRGATP